MTTILTFACPVGVLQVSDRLTSVQSQKPDPKTGQPFTRTAYDTLANKALVHCASNAIVTIGHGGPAYLEKLPTDEWIAEKLWGKQLPRFIDGSPCLQVGRGRSAWPDIGYAVRTLKHELERLPPSMPELSIVFAGWQKARRSARPIMIHLERKAKQRSVELSESPRWWPRAQNVRYHEIGGYVSKDAATLLSQKMKAAARGDFRAYEAALADTIRDISTRHPTSVGSNLLSITIPFYRYGIPCVRFLPTEDHKVAILNAAGEKTEVLTTYYSPWLIGPAMIYPPSFEVGDSFISIVAGTAKAQYAPFLFVADMYWLQSLAGRRRSKVITTCPCLSNCARRRVSWGRSSNSFLRP